MLAVSALQFLALYIIISVLLKVVTAYVLDRNPDSSVGKALAFID